MRPRLARLFFALCVVPLLPGCFTIPLGQASRPVSGRLSAGAVRLKVPYFHQDASTLCGLACVRMLTGYYRLPLAPPQERGLLEAARQEGGLSGAELKAALEASGYFVVVFPGSLDHSTAGLYSQLDQGHPVLVMLGSGGERHYCVLAGYDPGLGQVDLLDPDQGEKLLGRGRFERRWEGSNQFSLLAVPEALVDPAYSRGQSAGH